jgi:hypothetical protein
MDQAGRLFAHSLDHPRMAVAEQRHRDAAEEVQVLVAIVVPQARARAAHELDRVAGVGAHHGVALELHDRV